jgi:hypothetical protein
MNSLSNLSENDFGHFMKVIASVTPSVLQIFTEKIKNSIDGPYMTEKDKTQLSILITDISTEIFLTARENFENTVKVDQELNGN